MRRAERLFEIIEILRRARAPISAEAIGKTLGVTKRTVYRDMAALMAQGVPIDGEAGVGYVLDAGFHMPPLMLTAAEIDAAVLGAQWVQTRGEPALSDAATSLITKIEAVAPSGLQSFFLAPATSVAPVTAPHEVLDAAEIRQAIRQRAKILLIYRDDSDAETERVIWPILLGYRDAGRIIAAWCELRSGFRYFRTERIVQGKVLSDKVPRRMNLLRAEWQVAMRAERARFTEQARPPSSNA